MSTLPDLPICGTLEEEKSDKFQLASVHDQRRRGILPRYLEPAFTTYPGRAASVL
jgi:hypothetical protein